MATHSSVPAWENSMDREPIAATDNRSESHMTEVTAWTKITK